MSTWTRKLRGPVLSISIAAAVAAALPAHAAEKRASRQENIGVATGFTVGAAAGGPVGAIIGAATGAWLGDRYHRQAVKNEMLKANLGKTEAERARLVRNVSELNGSLTQTFDRTRDLEADVNFRTGDADLSPQAVEMLRKIGGLASALPGTKVRVSGYADPRGSEEFNAALSERRAETVAAVLIEAGVPVERLIIEGHGEKASSSAEGDLDGYAFERRVTVRIEHGEGSQLASAK